MCKATYQPGEAADELSMFPPDRANDISGGDPGLAFCESVRTYDPDHKQALALFWQLKERAFLVRDAIKVIIALAECQKFSNQREKVHLAFYKLKELYPALFSDLLFDTNWCTPYAERLEQWFADFRMSILEQNCSISSAGNGFYFMDPMVKKGIIRDTKKEYPLRKCPNLWKNLRAAAKLFDELCAVQ